MVEFSDLSPLRPRALLLVADWESKDCFLTFLIVDKAALVLVTGFLPLMVFLLRGLAWAEAPDLASGALAV